MSDSSRIDSARISLSSMSNHLEDAIEALTDVVDDDDDTAEDDDGVTTNPYLIVGKAEGTPGSEVEVEIIGTTPVPVRGFTLGIGCNPAELTLKGAVLTHEFASLVGATPEELTLVTSQGKRGGIQDYLSIMVGLFKLNAGGANVDTVIPHMMPMVKLTLKIAAGAKDDDRLNLINRAGYYGRKIQGPDGKEIRILIDNHYVATPRRYLRTDLQSGWVDVTK